MWKKKKEEKKRKKRRKEKKEKKEKKKKRKVKKKRKLKKKLFLDHLCDLINYAWVVTKLISHHSFHTKNIPSKFHQNLMNQNRNMLENVHFGPDQPNCPAHFCPFCPKTAQRDFFLKNLFWLLFTPYCPLTSCKKSEKINDSISFKVQKTSFWVNFGPF